METNATHYSNEKLESEGFTFVDSFIAKCSELVAHTTNEEEKVTCAKCLELMEAPKLF